MNYKVALIPGDGIGKEVVPESVRTLKALSQKFGFDVYFGRGRKMLTRRMQIKKKTMLLRRKGNCALSLA